MTRRPAPPLLHETAVEQLLHEPAASADPDLRRAVALLRTVVGTTVPPPSPALAELLDRGLDPMVVPFRRPAGRRRWAARTGAGLVAAAASLVVAGTAAALPPAIQDTVADLVSALTPFELPRPPGADGHRPAESDDDTSRARTPEPSKILAPTDGGPTAPAPGAEGSPGAVDSSPSGRGGQDGQPARQEADEESVRAEEEAAEQSQEAADDAEQAAAEEAQRRSDEEAAEQQRRSDEQAAEQQRASDEEAAEQQRRSNEQAAEDQRRSDQASAGG